MNIIILLTDFIKLHLDLINLKIDKKKSRICINLNCKKRASFNYENVNTLKQIKIRKNIYCDTHKINNMVDIAHAKCKKIGCKIRPSYGLESNKKLIFCTLHKTDNMIDLVSKICEHVKCKKNATFGFRNSKKRIYCGLHKLDNMIDVVNKKCEFKNCETVPNFNYIHIKKALYCNKHKLYNMVDVKNKNCKIVGCKKQPTYGFEKYNLAICCKEHKEIDMVDVRHIRCKTDFCDIRADNNKFKGFCVRCFIYNYPNDKLVRDYGTREAKVSQFIKDTYIDLNITYNKSIEGGCSAYRPDIFIDCLTHSVIVEVDEHQHKAKSYTPECELRRVNNLFTDLADRPIVFIRFNPDSYTNKKNQLIKSCFEYTEDKGLPKANKTLQTRLKKLKNIIDTNLEKIPAGNITTIKLYYDEF